MTDLMRGKRGLIMGVANNRSIAWGIAKACQAHGATVGLSYQGDALKKRVEPLAKEALRLANRCLKAQLSLLLYYILLSYS